MGGVLRVQKKDVGGGDAGISWSLLGGKKSLLAVSDPKDAGCFQHTRPYLFRSGERRNGESRKKKKWGQTNIVRPGKRHEKGLGRVGEKQPEVGGF